MGISTAHSVPPPTSNGTPDSAAAAELRRLHIASSVLKKKTPAASESGESNPTSKSAESDIAGLGITQLGDVTSTFPSVGINARPKPIKQSSISSSASDASSAPTGHPILITPSNDEVYLSRTGMTDVPVMITEEVFAEHLSPPSPTSNGTCHQEKIPKLDNDDNVNVNDVALDTLNDPNDLDGAVAADDAEYVPMFASLAHTPAQLAEIARMRETAIRDRERRTRQRSPESIEQS
jgi:hypothetical protein